LPALSISIAGAHEAANHVYSVESFDDVPSSLVDYAVGISSRFGNRLTSIFAAEVQLE
jgi:hypothetical protein